MSSKPVLDKVLHITAAHPNLQQFGQPDSNHVHDGRTACTHVICQTILLTWQGKLITLNQVNSDAGMPVNATAPNGAARGMRPNEMKTFFAKHGLPYAIRTGLTFTQVLAFSNRGPVFYAMRYGSAPEWRNFIYKGTHAHSPYARPLDHAGATQLTGFSDGPHAVLLLGYLPVYSGGKIIRYDEYRKEPNHHSASRPERPPYDIITTAQGRKEYEDYHTELGRDLIAAVPTRILPHA